MGGEYIPNHSGEEIQKELEKRFKVFEQENSDIAEALKVFDMTISEYEAYVSAEMPAVIKTTVTTNPSPLNEDVD